MKKELLTILFGFLVVLTLVSLFSYSPSDPSINHRIFSSDLQVENSFGLVGAYYAGGLIALFGLGAFWIPLVLLLCCVWYFKKRSPRIILFTLLGSLFLIVSTGSLLSIFHHEYLIFGKAYSSGGIVGIPLADFLVRYTKPAGSVIILFFLVVTGSVMVTGFSIFTFGQLLHRAVMALSCGIARQVKRLFFFLQKSVDHWRQQYRKRKEATRLIPVSSSPMGLKRLLPGISGGMESPAAGPANGHPDAIGDQTGPEIKTVKKKKKQAGQTPAREDLREKKNLLLPSVSLLDEIKKGPSGVDTDKLKEKGEILAKKLNDFGITGEVVAILPGPVLTTFEYRPAPGVKISKIVNLTDDLALALSAVSIRIIAPIPGKDVVGVELPNEVKKIVTLKELLVSSEFAASDSKLTLGLGKDIFGIPVTARLESMPHLLIAGATGTGKSVGLNAMITSILYKADPTEVKFIMVDPKRIELSVYDGIPHLISPVVTDMKKATNALFWAVREMERRYELLAETGMRNLKQYNAMVEKKQRKAEKEGGIEGDPGNLDGEGRDPLPEKIPYLVVIVDELADLMMVASRDVESALTRLAQMARAAGIHLILATQRPSVDVLTGIIKANFPTRVSFQVSSRTDSRTILDANGSERLLGNGDMLFLPPGTGQLTRIQCAFISEEEIGRITGFLKEQQAPDYVEDITAQPDENKQSVDKQEYDEKYDEAVALVTKTRQASISSVQRHLRIGYNRAARIIEIMETEGIIGPQEGAKQREVLVKSYDD
ncbi:MAG: DNA translocase FtsK 4TM domain-containing protein [Desulfobacteraceae bacterium]